MKIGTDEQFHSKLHYYLLKDTFYYLFYYLFFASFFVVFIVVTSLFVFVSLFVCFPDPPRGYENNSGYITCICLAYGPSWQLTR